MNESPSLSTRFSQNMLFSIKLAAGSSIAIITAQSFHLNFATSSGIIAMFTIMSTRRATLRLAGLRLCSFAITILLAWMVFLHAGDTWAAYGLFILLLSSILLTLDWKSSLSVNAVIGTHFWNTPDFRLEHIWNEFCLVCIGITVALILNLFHADGRQQKKLTVHLQTIECRLKNILELIASDLMLPSPQNAHTLPVTFTDCSSKTETPGILAWNELSKLEHYLALCLDKAWEYRENTFLDRRRYYVSYIDMRITQCKILRSLYEEIQKLRSRPSQAGTIAVYILYIKEHIAEKHLPEPQLKELARLLENFRKEPLPQTREQFESRAVLYHVLMDLEEFLLCKKRFLESQASKS